MKIEAGKYYRTRDGRKGRPMLRARDEAYGWNVGDVTYGRWADSGEDGYALPSSKQAADDLIAEWSEPVDLTAITTPLGLLDEATREALIAHGGPYEKYVEQGWEEITWPAWNSSTVYRVKQQPPKPREWWMRLDESGRCCGTDPVDGDPPQNWLPERTIRVRESPHE